MNKKEKNNKKSFKDLSQKTKIILVVAVIGLISLAYLFKNQLIVAAVNGSPIWRFSFIKQLEKQAGKQILENIITEKIVKDELNKQNIDVSNDDIENELSMLETQFSSQGQDFNQLLQMQGLTRDDLKEQIKIQLMLEELASKEASVSAQEVQQYYEDNQEAVYPEQELEEVQEEIKNQLMKQKTSEKISAIVQSLRESANIKYYLTF